MPHYFFFFNDPAPPEIYPLSLHAALPISPAREVHPAVRLGGTVGAYRLRLRLVGRQEPHRPAVADRKSTRLNSSHQIISYAVFCLKKKIPTTVSRSITHTPRKHHSQSRST